MKFIKIAPSIIKALQYILKSYPVVIEIVHDINKKNGKSFLVGGAVRDLILERKVKDLDIEVHGISLNELEELLKKHGSVSSVGKAFGVLRLHGLDVDWSLPRIDKFGRKPDIKIDKNMDIEQAFRRRDLTINSMGIDLISNELIDPFNGIKDLSDNVLRSPDLELFVQDPLRFFRVMQFVGRFEMKPDQALNNVCLKMDLSDVSVERIETEFKKLFLKSKYPSLGLEWLKNIKRLNEIFPELYSIIDIPQDKTWHPEGEVFEHTMQALDASASFDYVDDKEKLIVMFAVLCHDFGKPKTTEKVGGVWKSLGHAKEGVNISKTFMKKISKNNDLIDAVCKLVRYHMAPVQLVASHAKLSAYKRLAKKLSPNATMVMLAKVALADKRGRNPIKGKPLTKKISVIDSFLEIAKKAKVEERPEKAILKGRDFIDVIPPGPELGVFVNKAYELQIEKGILDREELKQAVFISMKEQDKDDDLE